jgi:site-specific recombinase XerD
VSNESCVATAESPVFTGANGEPWTAEGFNKWRQRGFRAALDAAGVDAARPYDLRHSFASLLLHEGRSVTTSLASSAMART